MFVPAHFSAGDAEVRDLLAGCGAADLVTSTPRGLVATFLPVLFDPTVGEHGALLAHVARNNDQWSEPAAGESLFIVHGPDAYVTPSWYASKREHGRVVPTWNYLTAHVYGRLAVHDDQAWVGSMVRRLTDHHEGRRAPSWSVDDAPPAFIDGQLRAIVGLELVITRIEAKAKMSQNRPEADREGVVEGYLAEGDTAMAEAVRDASA
ncbi:FMN-binding negative transcriptional regulator [Spirillospora sp. CA-142024]|uniref:FMN-binding negative transcriptional regulator n=1 Tax=Spirillospora sp. CA-142024 TaxID=3240036 RepID=UPI003D91DC05